MNRVKDYLEAHACQMHDASEVIEEFGYEISQMRGRCVDIGCGPATDTRQLLMPKLPVETSVVGMDISKNMIDFARMAHADEKRLSFIKLNIETDELPSNQINAYDNAVSFYCINWCQNIRRAFKNIYQLLRPGGNAILLFIASHTAFDSYLNLYNNTKYKPYMEDVLKYIPYFQHCNNSKAALQNILEESGFTILHCTLREKTYTYKSIDDLKKHMIAVNPFVDTMPKDRREQFENDLLYNMVSNEITSIYANNGSNKEHKIPIRYYAFVVHLKKPTD